MKTVCKILVIFAALCAPVRGDELRDLLISALEHYKADNCAEALPFFDSVLNADLPAVNDNSTLAYALNYYAGYCARLAGDPDKAARYFEKALLLTSDSAQIPVLNTFLGEMAREKGEYQKAEMYYQRALHLLKDDTADSALIWYFMAETHRGMKKYDEALADCNRSIQISSALKSVRLELVCLTLTGEVYNEQGSYSEAIRTFSSALQLARGGQLPLESANNHMGLALVYKSLGKTELSRQNYDEALRLYVISGNTVNIPFLVNRFLEMPEGTQEQNARLVEFYEQQADLLLGVGDDESLLWMQILVADYKRRAGNIADAIQTYQAVIDLSTQENFAEEAAKAAVMLSDLQFEIENFSGAMATLAEAEHFQAMQSPPRYLAAIYAQQGKLNEELGRKEQAANYYRKAMAGALTAEEKEKYADKLKNLSQKN